MLTILTIRKTIGLRENLTFETFRSIRAKYACAAISTVPDVLVSVALLPQYISEGYKANMAEAKRTLRKLQTVMNSPALLSELKFVYIGSKNLKVVVCIDASFAVNIDKSSQLSLLAMTRD